MDFEERILDYKTALCLAAGTQDAMKAFLLCAAAVIGGLATIASFNWLVVAANEADLFC